MERRINNIGKSMVERKKNVHDPIAHPTYLLRNGNKSNEVTMDHLFSKVVNFNKTIVCNKSNFL